MTVTASTASWRGVTEAKNPSVLRRKLSLLLTPSSVMLRKPSGSPLIVESRLVPVVLTPGRNATAFSALRVGVGMRRQLIGVERRGNRRGLGVDQLRAARDVDGFLEAADFQRERNGDGWPGRHAHGLGLGVLNPVSVAVTV